MDQKAVQLTNFSTHFSSLSMAPATTIADGLSRMNNRGSGARKSFRVSHVLTLSVAHYPHPTVAR